MISPSDTGEQRNAQEVSGRYALHLGRTIGRGRVILRKRKGTVFFSLLIEPLFASIEGRGPN